MAPRFFMIVLALAAPLLAAPRSSPAQDATKRIEVTFSLAFPAMGRHAPWYVAQDLGYYADEGLEVRIIPGKGTAQIFQPLESGEAQFAFADVAGVVLARAGGATPRLLAINYQLAPYAIFSLAPGADVTDPRQLVGLEIASSAGSFTPNVIMGYMRQHGLDPGTVRFVNVDGPARVDLLLSRKVPAIETFVFAARAIAARAIERQAPKSTAVKTFLLGDHGLELYANGIAALDGYLAGHADVARKFVRASLRGWQYALRYPEAAADIELKAVKGLERDNIIAELEMAKALATPEDTRTHGLGSIDPAKMARSVDFVAKYAGIRGEPPKPDDVYRTDLLPVPPIPP
jgi:NitT/TauT family transport system substrate-binding protein